MSDKTIEQNFIDWESSAFGFGYGTGEPLIIPLLKAFLDNCRPGTGSYDYEEMAKILGPVPTWFLINVFGQQNIIEYGTSPRFGWLTKEGLALKQFVLGKTAYELVSLLCDRTEDYCVCYPDACNCGEEGYEAGKKCVNPFWPGHAAPPRGEHD